ncbi:MAG: twin-arginine translocation signal domain-containing protein, partial [Desulfoplanes sp.]
MPHLYEAFAKNTSASTHRCLARRIPMIHSPILTRRDFLKATGIGILSLTTGCAPNPVTG